MLEFRCKTRAEYNSSSMVSVKVANDDTILLNNIRAEGQIKYCVPLFTAVFKVISSFPVPLYMYVIRPPTTKARCILALSQ